MTDYSYKIIRVSYLLVTISVLTFVSVSVSAQQTDPVADHDPERWIDLTDPEVSESELEELLEYLERLAANPVNINRASADELTGVPGIDLRMAQEIVRYRQSTRPFEAVSELTAIPGIGTVTLGRIEPFLTAGTPDELARDLYLNPRYWLQNRRFESFNRAQTVLQQQEGYQRPDTLGGYTGNPLKYYQRYRLQSRQLSLNLTQQKQPGEPVSGLTGFDYTSWHLAVRNTGRLQKLVAGDYSLRTGQGLILWTGASFGKGMDVTGSAIKNERGVRAYTSTLPDHFRGAAVTWGRRLSATAFYSGRKLTASEISQDTIRFPANSGRHRTLSERERRHNTNQVTFGGRLRTEIPSGFIGITGYINRFDRFVQRGDQPYQRYSFEGTQASAVSVDYRLVTGPLLLFGEAGRTQNGGFGMITGSAVRAGPDTELLLVYRNYGRRFQPVFGSAFGEQSGGPKNEEGIYIGLTHQLTDHLQISTYFDQFRFPAPRFQTRQSTRGYDWLWLTEYNPSREFDLSFLIRFKERDEEFADTDSFGRELHRVQPAKRWNARVNLGLWVHPNIRLRSRVEIVHVNRPEHPPETGYLLYQDLRLLPAPGLTVDARITFFETGGFDSRLYQFENDLLYVFSSTMLFHRGQRMYVLINYRLSDNIQLWLKASTTVYENQHTIGSGLDQIMGNRRSDVGVQLRFRF